MDQCGICRDEIVEATKIVECGHIFCFSCISKWCNVSNSCPLCQQRFLKLHRLGGGGHHHQVKAVDRREENWMEVMEQYDSEECSIHTDDEEEGEDSEELDQYEPDFVLPDNVILYENGTVVDMRSSDDPAPFRRPPRGQPDSIIETEDGQIITISWYLDDDDQSSELTTSDEEYVAESEDEE